MKYANNEGLIVERTEYEHGMEYVVLNNGRRYKVYYNGLYRKDSRPYFNYKGRRKFLRDFVQLSWDYVEVV